MSTSLSHDPPLQDNFKDDAMLPYFSTLIHRFRHHAPKHRKTVEKNDNVKCP